MSLRDLVVRFDTPHPQPLIDAVYKEFIDNHPADAEVDIVLAIKQSDEDRAEVKIVDARLMRVSGGGNGPARFLATPDDDSWPLSMLKEMDAWGRNIEGSDGYLWLHKHPEGMAYAGPKDELWHQWLVSIDYAAGEKRRVYRGLAVINRNDSAKLGVKRVEPLPNTDDMEIDSKIVARSFDDWASTVALPESDPLRALSREIIEGVKEYVAGGKSDTALAAVLKGKAVQLITGVRAKTAEVSGGVQIRGLEGLPPEIAQAIQDALSGRQGAKPSIGFAPPDKKIDIFGLPKFAMPAQDNTKPQIGFRPPAERDRLN